MLTVSEQFKAAFRDSRRSVEFKAVINGVEYVRDSIIELTIRDSIQNNSTFNIGATICSELSLSLRTTDEIPIAAEVRLYLRAAELIWDVATMSWITADVPWDDASSESIPYGVYYIDERKQVGNYWRYTCLDALILGDTPYVSQLSYPAPMADVLAEVCDQAGIESEAGVDQGLTFAVAPTGYTCRGVIRLIAQAMASCARINKVGKLVFAPFKPAAPVETIKTSEYKRLAHTNPVKTISKVVCTVDDEGAAIESGTGGADNTITIDNPYLDQLVLDAVVSKLDTYTYNPFTLDWICLPWIEVGDQITIEEYVSKAWLDMAVAWDAADEPWTGIARFTTTVLNNTIRYKGGLTATISASSDSQQQSEFKPTGTLTDKVNKLSKASVKLAKPYYGVTITRDQGLIVEKSDHSSKAVLNSDELTFYKGSEKALWFDVPSDEYKFSGTIEASKFVGGSIQIGSNFSVDSSGYMKASGAEFSGSITASDISGGTITGSTIRTAAIGQRVELSSSSNLLMAYRNENEYIAMHPDWTGSPTMRFATPNSEVFMSPIDTIGAFALNATKGNINITAQNGNLFLASGSGKRVIFDDWGVIRNNSTGKTLKQDLDNKLSGNGVTAAFATADGRTVTVHDGQVIWVG